MKVWLNAFSICCVVIVGIIGHSYINDSAKLFIEMRESDSVFFTNLIKDNWGGITSISHEEKKQVLESIDPKLAAVDIKYLLNIAMFSFYALLIGAFIDRLFALYRALAEQRLKQ